MRISEAAGLRWRDVDFVGGEIVVTLQLSRPREGRAVQLVPVKTQASVRSVPIFPAVEEMLVRRLEVEQQAGRGRDDDFVFCTRRGTPLQQRNVARRGVAAAGAAAGLGHVNRHDLRRSVCSLAARRHVDPVAAAEVPPDTPSSCGRPTRLLVRPRPAPRGSRPSARARLRGRRPRMRCHGAATGAPVALSPDQRRRETPAVAEWAHLGSNQGPLACEASALPLSYAPGRGLLG